MARHKFASNVVEKALVCAPTESRRTLIEEILTVQSDGSNPVVVMMKDQFGSKFSGRSSSLGTVAHECFRLCSSASDDRG